MKLQSTIRTAAALLALCSALPTTVVADVLCRDRKTSVVALRKSCKRTEVVISPLSVGGSSTRTAPETSTGVSLSTLDSGAVSSGTDSNTVLDILLRRLGASGGTLNNTGLNVEVVGDTGGDSTNVGLSVTTSGADSNYTAIFQGGNVGIRVSDPDEALEIAGRIHLGQTVAPSATSNKLYNVAGSLFWNGQAVNVGTIANTGITGVTAGAGLSGGGTSGTVTLSVDSGTSANQLVRLNSSAQLPAVSGANLTTLNASSITSGVISDSLLSSNVSKLGTNISLSSEVTGTLPVSNGGTGATSLSDLITLGTHTSGSYVASVATSGGLSGGASGSEAGALTLSLDQTFSPTWTAVHNFTSSVNIGTAVPSVEVLHVDGRIELEQRSAPTVTTDILYNVGGQLFFNGVNLSSPTTAGDITGVTAGTGLTGGGTSGAVTLTVDTGTTASKIVQLNGSAELPAVSGANLTGLNANAITTGTVADGRLSNAVTKLGTSIDLTSEITGTLPIANGGTGATALTNLITLGTHTTGSYLSTITGGTGITVSGSGSETATPTITLDQSITPSWTGTHTFSGVTTDIATASGQDLCIVPGGAGRVGIGTTSPAAMLDTAMASTSITAGTERGARVTITDSGATLSGTDITKGLEVVASRTGVGVSATVATTGVDVAVTGDTSGASSAIGLNVAVSGADANYPALFTGGNVGVGTTTPAARMDVLLTSTDVAVGTEIGQRTVVSDTGNVTSGVDYTYGQQISVARTGASGGTLNTTGLLLSATGSSAGTSTATGLDVSVSGADTNYAALFNGGNVGIGTVTPIYQFQTAYSSVTATAGTEVANYLGVIDSGVVTTGTDTTRALEIALSRTGPSGGTIDSTGLTIAVNGSAGGTSTAKGLEVSATGADTNIAAAFTAGKVVLGSASGQVASSTIPAGSMVLDNGTLCIDDGGDNCDDDVGGRLPGTIYAESATVTAIDLAENFPVEKDSTVGAGEIVMIDSKIAPKCTDWSDGAEGISVCSKTEPGKVPFVARAQGSTKRVIGIVSTKPGITLGGHGQPELMEYRKVPVALAGRVPLKVSLESGEIEVGDRVTLSSTAGVGMRANEGDMVVGIALESLSKDEFAANGLGELLVLVR